MSVSHNSSPLCWILTDGRIGSENHARGVAEALGLAYTVHSVALRQPWKSLSPWALRWVPAFAFRTLPAPPWPDVLITCGRTPAVGALYLRNASKGKTFCIHIMHAGINPRAFDLLITPQHDGITGENVLTPLGALHRVTAQKLRDAAEVWQPKFAALKPTLSGLLVGGVNLETAQKTILPYIKAAQGSIIATCSRRTDKDAAALIHTAIQEAGGYVWDGTGDNPYFGILACTNTLAVTDDSVSMASEAAFTGKPLWLLSTPNLSVKHQRFNQSLIDGGHARRFNGTLDDWTPIRLDEMSKIIPHIRAYLAMHKGSKSVEYRE